MITVADVGHGAEATLRLEDGHVVKDREAKRYRHPELDGRLREERTDTEARLLEAAREAGVQVPDVLDIGTTTLTLEHVEGPVLKDVFAERTGSAGARTNTRSEFVDRDDLRERIGADIARLHRRDVIHGDLTTSNIIVADGPVFIDFGLGFFSDRVEDRATDLRLLEQVLDSTHPDVAAAAGEAILDGYRRESDEADAVLERLDAVRERGRYK